MVQEQQFITKQDFCERWIAGPKDSSGAVSSDSTLYQQQNGGGGKVQVKSIIKACDDDPVKLTNTISQLKLETGLWSGLGTTVGIGAGAAGALLAPLILKTSKEWLKLFS